AVIGRELKNPLLDAWMLGFRQRFGNRVIPKAGGARGTLKAFRQGDGVGYLLDQDALGMGIFVTFLGRWVSTFSSAGAMAVRFDLPILPVFSWPEGEGRLRIRFEAPFHVPRTGDEARDTWVATQRMTSCIEAQVRKDPRLWFWMHNRFKTQPGQPGSPELPPVAWTEGFEVPSRL
ncbi:MAG TPA: lysophospholipid acyltransferase family protein, partial [Holophagaceae bacterium]